MASRLASPHRGPISCSPTGNPAARESAGTDNAGWPVKLAGRDAPTSSARTAAFSPPISTSFSPSLGAGIGEAGARIASTCSNAVSKSRSQHPFHRRAREDNPSRGPLFRLPASRGRLRHNRPRGQGNSPATRESSWPRPIPSSCWPPRTPANEAAKLFRCALPAARSVFTAASIAVRTPPSTRSK